MRMTTNEQILKAFVNGKTSGKVGNLTIEGTKLFNYGTLIASVEDCGFIVNRTKYSPTTSRIQNKLVSLLPSRDVIEVTGVPMGFGGDLSKFIKQTV